MKKVAIALFSLVLISSCGNNNKPEDSTEAADDQNEQKFDETEKDADFAVKAADGGMFEVMVADLVLSRTTNASVRSLADMMKTDHSGANAELKALAAQKNISLPDSVSADKRKKYNDLAEKTGADFDKEYVDMMVKDHNHDVDMFDKESTDGKDQDVKSWAGAKLPTLRHHLQMAEETQDKLK
jgi:putative membrane protein